MSRIKELDIIYNQCVSEGFLEESEEIDTEKAKSLLNSAELNFKSLIEITPILEKNKNYGMLWSDRYEIIRKLIQGIVLLDKMISNNHQCLLAYFCIKNKQLDMDWEIIETMRILRNRIHYDGGIVFEDDWKKYKIRFDIYIQSLIKVLKERLKKTG